MGVVYRAIDTRLGRALVIKMLPPEATADADRNRRFIQEARAASAGRRWPPSPAGSTLEAASVGSAARGRRRPPRWAAPPAKTTSEMPAT